MSKNESMQIQCPSCQSANVKRFSLVYAEGANQVSATALSFDSNRRVGYTHLSGQIQSKASSITSPPREQPVFSTLLGGCVLGIFLAVVCIVANVLLAAFAGWSLLPWKLWMTLGGAGGLVCGIIAASNASRYNREVLPSRREGWNDSFLCQVCGEGFIPTHLADDASPRFGKESLQIARSERLLEEGYSCELRDDITGAARAYAAAIGAGNEEAVMYLDRVLSEADEATCRSLIDEGIAADLRLAEILVEECYGDDEDLLEECYGDDEDEDSRFSVSPARIEEIRRLYMRAAKRGQLQGAIGMASSYISLGEEYRDIDKARHWISEAALLGASEMDRSSVETSIRVHEISRQGGDPSANFYEAMEYQKQQREAHDVQYLLASRKNSRNAIEVYRKYFMDHFDKYDALTQRELRKLDVEVRDKDASNDWTEVDTQGLTSKAAIKRPLHQTSKIVR